MRQHFHQTRTFLPQGSKLRPTGAVLPNQICLNWKTTPAASPPRHLLQLNTAGLTASRWGAPGRTAGAVTATLENLVRPPPPPIPKIAKFPLCCYCPGQTGTDPDCSRSHGGLEDRTRIAPAVPHLSWPSVCPQAPLQPCSASQLAEQLLVPAPSCLMWGDGYAELAGS